MDLNIICHRVHKVTSRCASICGFSILVTTLCMLNLTRVLFKPANICKQNRTTPPLMMRKLTVLQMHMRCDAPMLHSWPYPMANFPQRALQEATSYSTCAQTTKTCRAAQLWWWIRARLAPSDTRRHFEFRHVLFPSFSKKAVGGYKIIITLKVSEKSIRGVLGPGSEGSRKFVNHLVETVPGLASIV